MEISVPLCTMMVVDINREVNYRIKGMKMYSETQNRRSASQADNQFNPVVKGRRVFYGLILLGILVLSLLILIKTWDKTATIIPSSPSVDEAVVVVTYEWGE